MDLRSLMWRPRNGGAFCDPGKSEAVQEHSSHGHRGVGRREQQVCEAERERIRPGRNMNIPFACDLASVTGMSARF
uniref:Uncharacterized protein n=1 Tax=Oryza meridionalis TaxID=40149 RepID=A0A0E0EL41_9ORYZ